MEDPRIGEARLGIVVLTHDEEANLPGLLDSIKGIPCSLFVLDSGSTDETIRIAEDAGAVVWHHPFDNYGAQRNRAQEMLPSEIDWVLHLDADERLTPQLNKEITELLAVGSPVVDGYLLCQRTVFLGRWIRHGGHYPSFHLRLFRRDRGRCEDRLYDQHFVVDGAIERLEHDYIDVIGTDIASWSYRHIRWANLEAEEILSSSSHGTRVAPRLKGSAIERKRWLRTRVLYRSPLFARAFLYFLYRYILRMGFLDGREGLIFHFLQGCWYRFLVDATIYERTQLE